MMTESTMARKKRNKEGMMNAKWRLIKSTCVVLVVMAHTTGFTGGARTIDEEVLHAGAQAEITIADGSHLGEKELVIAAAGLPPLSVYTVWFINEGAKKSMGGVGSPPHEFTTNVQGEGDFVARVTLSELRIWEKLKVVLHKDGDASNMVMDNLDPAFVLDTAALVAKSALLSPEQKYKTVPETMSYEEKKGDFMSGYMVSPEAKSVQMSPNASSW